MLEIFINGKSCLVPKNITVLQACEQNGIQIPRFCYHEKLSIAGNCRMCLVEMEKSLKPIASCAMSVMPQMRIWTNTILVKKAREGVMEFLLANHPLDCPICDQGGECDLQDQAMLFGNDRGRFYELKRSVGDKNCGPLIKTVMTRCIHCTRCVRFSTELGGRQELGTTGRGIKTEIGNYISKAITSEVSGNIIDLCPVGALTSKPYAFTARSWELKRTETIDTFDSMGSNISMHTSGKRIMRVLPVLHEEVNEEWINDRTRFGYDGYLKQRLTRPLKQNFNKISWENSFKEFSVRFGLLFLQRNLLILGFNHVSLEDVYAIKKFSQLAGNKCSVENNLVPRLLDFRAYYQVNTGYGGISETDLCLLVGTNLRVEMPLLLVRLRREQRRRDLQIGSFGSPENYGLSLINVGNSWAKLFTFLEGKSRYCSVFSQAKKPLVFIGDSIHDSQYNNQIIEGFFRLKNVISENWVGLNNLYKGSSIVNALELGVINTTVSDRTVNVINVNANENVLNTSGSRIYLGSHGKNSLKTFDLILPLSSTVESESIFINGEGRAQINKFLFTAPRENRIGYQVFSFLQKYFFEKSLNIKRITKEHIRTALVEEYPIVLNRIGYYSFYLKPEANKRYIKNGLINSFNLEFYQTDLVTRSSRILADAKKSVMTLEKVHYID